jgi:RNA polymerase sigma factor (sigma-70 family)
VSSDEREPEVSLWSRFRSGDSEAGTRLFARYSERLLRLAEQQLSRELAGRLDGEDVVQSALRSFFRRDARGEFQIDSSAQLWRLLVKITLNKARAKARHHKAQVRDVSADIPGDEAGLAQLSAHDPTPEEATAMIEEIETLLRGLPESHGQVLRMRLEGHSVAEIAANLGVSRQTVYRALHLFQQRLGRDPTSSAS